MFGLVTQQARDPVSKGAWSGGARPATADRTGYGPLTQSLATHGVSRTQVNEPVAQRPEPLTTVHTAQPDPRGGALAGSMSCNQGSADIQHLDLRHGASPQAVTVDPGRHPFTTAPTGAVPSQPRGSGPAALTSPGARS
ncbi:hypothetical protein AB0O05_28780 [Streptomyces sp. NPDC093084]|uniref:hypothetical protein n=1 Tax=Streptomyces sp. NPDC093084 TaxID=3155197 RepID=UPI0034219382